MAETPLLRTVGLRVGHGRVPLLPAVDVDLRPGEFWCIVGRNGAGKTTWFRTVLGLHRPVAGCVEWPGGPVPISYVAQRSQFDPLYPLSAREVVEQGLVSGWGFVGGGGRDRRARVDDALRRLSITGLEGQTFRSLSEGQKQRVLLARMLVSRARLALLDEPTAAMDAVAEEESMHLLDALRRETGMAVVVVSHHLDVALRHAGKVLFLDKDDDEVVVGTPQEVVLHPAFVRRYGRLQAEPCAPVGAP